MEENKYKIVYLPLAYKDLIELTDYLLDNSVSKRETVNYINGLNKTISTLETFPLRGKSYNSTKKRKAEYRFIIYKAHIIFYVIKNQYVEIRRVLHKKRDFKNFF